MATFRAKPIVVNAFKIVFRRVSLCGEDDGFEPPGAVYLTLEDGQEVIATPEMTARMHPDVGDYWVVQEDGYCYLNPKDVFERKYERCQRP